ncbi:transporter substrate-binding domain-containing protein [Microbaculum sp. FT89]|uniref:transporter substrate-binding domain-containing protein n=1 Tax=Microbaculum sp. FT89 TaxID=3447298 RepID=UPI003F531518
MRRNGLNILIGLVALSALATAAPAGAGAETAPSFVSGGKLLVCLDPTFPPMEYMENADANQPVGFDVDVITALAETWKVEPQIVTLDFSGLLPALDAKRCDMMISGATLKPERLESFNGVPYLKTGSVVVGRSDADGAFSSYEDFSGKTLSYQSGSIYEKIVADVNAALKTAGKAEIDVQAYPKGTDVVQQVLLGRVTGGITLDSEFAFRDLQKPGELKVIFSDPNKEQYAAYFRKEPASDQAAVEAAVAELVSSGRLKAIAETWRIPADALDGIGQ